MNSGTVYSVCRRDRQTGRSCGFSFIFDLRETAYPERATGVPMKSRFAEFDAAMAQDIVGGGGMEIEIRQTEI
jgi:hypothetical protein